MRVTVEFAAAHLLRGYPGDCSRLHGHNWKVEVEASASRLDELGMGIDFKVLKAAAQETIQDLDHTLVNELGHFSKVNPTAENMAAYIFERLTRRLNDERVAVTAVTLWETDRACVRYSEEIRR